LIGLGLVGNALAERLVASGYGVIGFDIREERCEALERLGGEVVRSSREVGNRAARVILSLFDTETVIRVLEGEEGALSGERLPRFIVDTTTGDPDRVVALGERLRRRGVAYLDTTLSGSSRQVRSREAVFFVGADDDAFEACRDLFEALARRFVRTGGIGSATRMKLATNLLVGLNRAALAEALAFAERLGFDPRVFLDVVHGTPAYNAAVDLKGEKMVSGDFAVESRIAQHRKDVALIREYAERVGAEAPLTAVHERLLDALISDGYGDEDNAAIIRAFRHNDTEEPNDDALGSGN
jgi:3-hydroxyisobutyrate dehydrogenase-like beta-hydroxyacid dehydrogenase